MLSRGSSGAGRLAAAGGRRARALWSVPASRFLVVGDVNRGMFEAVLSPEIETDSDLTADWASSMAFELKFDNGAASEATTWVTRAPAAEKVPFLGETLFEASKRGMCIGLHVKSGSIIVHFAELVTCQNAMCKMRTVLGKGMLMNPPLGDFEALDSYHAEFWELIPPQLPPMMDLILKYDSSGNDFGVGAAATTETDASHASHGELFTQFFEEFLRAQLLSGSDFQSDPLDLAQCSPGVTQFDFQCHESSKKIEKRIYFKQQAHRMDLNLSLLEYWWTCPLWPERF